MSATDKAPRVNFSVESQVARVILSRPDKHNALDMAMFHAIDQVIKSIAKDSSIRAVIVSGAGESFCSGLDVKSVMQSRRHALGLLWKWWPSQANLAQRVCVGWRKLTVPVIMVLHGKCWGGGLQIALGGDFLIADPQTSLAIMEAKWGLIPDMGGTLALKERLTVDAAMQLAMLAEPINAEQALALNLVSQLSSQPMQQALQLAEQLKQRSPDTNRAIKKLYHQTWCPKPGKILAGETINQWKIIFGKNRQIALKKALGDDSVEFRSR